MIPFCLVSAHAMLVFLDPWVGEDDFFFHAGLYFEVFVMWFSMPVETQDHGEHSFLPSGPMGTSLGEARCCVTSCE